MPQKKHLSFDSLRRAFSALLYKLKDKRQKNKIHYSLHDIVMSAFACMHLQCPNLLAFQRRMQTRFGRNNLQTQFNVTETPEDSALRDGVDQVDSESFAPLFKDYLTRLQRGNHLKDYQFLPGMYLSALDGTQFFSSKSIHCKHCLTTTNKKTGVVTYSHKVVQAAIVHPDKKQVFPMMPEEIKNTDGETKQDCEINAAKRLMPKIKKAHPRMTLIRLGDSLYAKQPFIEETLEQGDHFIFSVKPGDHVALTNYLKTVTFERCDETDQKGRRFVYEWCSNAPLNDRKDTLLINYMRCRLVTPLKDGTDKVTYLGSWITDLPITADNVGHLVRGARCKWHIENECFNTLKNQGYEIEHNYGHGEENLCFNFYILTILAFLGHQILELTDKLYQKTRKKLVTLRDFWEDIRSAFRRYLYTSWDSMLENAYDPEKNRTFIQPQAPPL